MAMNLTDMVLAVSARQETMESRLEELSGSIKALEAQLAELKRSATAPSVAIQKAAAASAPVAGRMAVQTKEEITPEVLLVIAAAATAFMGKHVHIRSARMLQSPYEVVNPWSQQGRVFVQSSHDLLRM